MLKEFISKLYNMFIRVKLANACTRIKFEAIEICLVFIRTSFSTFMIKKVTSKCTVYVWNQIITHSKLLIVHYYR